MDFNSILQACYKKDINPFMLCSTMSDLCKGNLKLKEQTETLYKLYKERDIFSEISLCRKDDFTLLLGQYSQKERECLKSIVRFIHPDWEIKSASELSTKLNVKIQKVNTEAKSTKGKVLLQQNKHFIGCVKNAPKVKRQNNKHGQILTKRDIEIKSLLSDVVVCTNCNFYDIEIIIHNAGKRFLHRGGIIKRKTCTYINVEEVVAEKIEIRLPKDKYLQLKVYKSSGELTVNDKENCFEGVSIVGGAVKTNCYTSAKSVYISAEAGNVNLEYVAMQDGKIEVRNTLGNVSLQTFLVKKIIGELFSQKGVVNNNHKQTAGYNMTIKIKSKYGNINVS